MTEVSNIRPGGQNWPNPANWTALEEGINFVLLTVFSVKTLWFIHKGQFGQ